MRALLNWTDTGYGEKKPKKARPAPKPKARPAPKPKAAGPKLTYDRLSPRDKAAVALLLKRHGTGDKVLKLLEDHGWSRKQIANAKPGDLARALVELATAPKAAPKARPASKPKAAKIRALNEDAEDAALRFRLDLWYELEQRCKEAGLYCMTSPGYGEAYIEGLVVFKLDYDTGLLKLNGRPAGKVSTHDEVWAACKAEIERVCKAMLPPRELEKLLVDLIGTVAARSRDWTPQNGVPLLEVLKEMKRRRGRGYDARLFEAELSLLTSEPYRNRIALQPVTDARKAISVYFKGTLGSRKVGWLAVRN